MGAEKRWNVCPQCSRGRVKTSARVCASCIARAFSRCSHDDGLAITSASGITYKWCCFCGALQISVKQQMVDVIVPGPDREPRVLASAREAGRRARA